MSTNGTSTPGRRSTWQQLKRRPPVLAPYRNVPQDRGGDTILAQEATALLRAARAGDASFVDLLLKHKALVDLPSKEGVTPLMAAAGVEFGTRVTRGRNRTNEGVVATRRLMLDTGADINARMVTEPRPASAEGAAYRAGPPPVALDAVQRPLWPAVDPALNNAFFLS